MSYTDPQSIKISGTTTSLPRTDVGKGESEYTSADGRIKLKAASQYGKRTRRTVRVDVSKITADPFIPANNTEVSSSVYLVFDIPVAGYSAAEMKAVYDGFIETIQASSSAAITKLLAGES